MISFKNIALSASMVLFASASMVAGNQLIVEPDETASTGHVGNGFARNGFIIGVTLYILSKFTERLVEALLIEDLIEEEDKGK